MNIDLNDIIVGISTQQANGAISIVRLSGSGSIDLVNKIFLGKDLTKVATHTIHYGYIVDKDEKIDEVLVSIFKAPKTYTKEDVVEINCHGGLFVTNKIYELCVLSGARPAEAGEFTKRAFLNGRIDLSQAEAVMDMIEAENNSAVKMASKGLQGYIKDCVNSLRKRLLDIISLIEVNIDYPEYDDVVELTNNEIKPQVELIEQELAQIIEKSKSARFLKNGINVAIIGRPNVGKSSLLNALIEENKAIVTNIPGTTRDLIETKINIGNITCNLIDTAGVRNTEDVVEKIGVEKTLKTIEEADINILVLDGSEELTNEDKELLNSLKDRPHLILINKKDLGTKINIDSSCVISTKDSNDIDKVKEAIINFARDKGINNKDITYISNARQIEKFNLAHIETKDALKEINDGVFIDMVELHLKAAWSYLGEIIGETSSESLLDELFSKFCLGK